MKKFNKKQLEQNRRKLEREKDKVEFIAKMQYIADAFGNEGTFALLPQIIVDFAYKMRFIPFRVCANEGMNIKKKQIQFFQSEVTRLSKRRKLDLPNGKKVSMEDYNSAGTTLFNVVHLVDAQIQDKKNDENGALTDFFNRTKEMVSDAWIEKVATMNYDLVNVLAAISSDIEHELFSFTIERLQYPGKTTTETLLKLNCYKPDIKYFNTKDARRPAYCVCCAIFQQGLQIPELDPALFGVKSDSEKLSPVKVYVQSHALRRLEERLDGLRTSLLYFSLYAAIVDKKLIRNGKNKALIEFRLVSTKVGYLLAEYIDGAVLIHTFLFITNNGTPEGQKLTELTGLGKLDKKYLALDKLSSFVQSDITKNEKLKTIFENAGCGSLLDIEDTVKNVYEKHSDNSITELMLHYFKTEDDLQEVYEYNVDNL